MANMLLSLQKRAARISTRIAELYDAHFDQFEATFDDARAVRTELAELQRQFTEHARQLEIPADATKDAPQAPYAGSSTDNSSDRDASRDVRNTGGARIAANDNAFRIRECQESLRFLDELVTLHDKFTAFDGLLEAGDFVHAAQLANHMARAMHKLTGMGHISREFDWPSDLKTGESELHLGTRPSGAHIMDTVRLQVSRKHARLCARLEELFDDTFVIGAEEVAMTIKRRHAGVHGHLHYDSPTNLGALLASIWHFDCVTSSVDMTTMQQQCDRIIAKDSFLRRKLNGLSRSISQTVLRAATSSSRRYPEPSKGSTWSRIQFLRKSNDPVGVDGSEDAGAPTDARMDVDEVIDRVLIVLDFIEVELCREEEDDIATARKDNSPPRDGQGGGDRVMAPRQLGRACVRAMGEELWNPSGSLTRTILDVLRDALPDDESMMPQFNRVVQAARRFEERLSEAGWMSPNSENHFAAFVSNADEKFIQKRRTNILVKTRNMLLQDYHNSVVIGANGDQRGAYTVEDGDTTSHSDNDNTRGVMLKDVLVHKDGSQGGIFSLPKMSVTRCAYRLVETLHSILSQTSSVSADHARMLWQTARDVVELFRIIVPSAHGTHISTLPRIAMLFYCDCRYVAHHAMVVAHMYRASLPAPLDRCASMVDLAPLVRSLGVHQFVAQIASQRQELLHMMIRLGDLSHLTDDEIGENAENTVSGILFHLSKLKNLWSDVLPVAPTRDGPSVLDRAIGSLLGVVATDVVKRVAALEVRGSDGVVGNSHELKRLLRSFVSGAVQIFDGPNGDGRSGGLGMSSRDVESFVPGWAALLLYLEEKMEI